MMKNYVIAGASARCLDMFAKPLAREWSHTSRVLGVYDPNTTRAGLVAKLFPDARVYTGFDAMLQATKPDCVIVTTTDDCHADYVVKALYAGCDVLCEKPMCNTTAACQAILQAERETGKTVTVTFNCRFMPLYAKVKQLLQEGTLGDILHVNFEYLLDDSHGADYFRRWHRTLARSNSLLVHKSTHHLDIINWWMASAPQAVAAVGTRQFYGTQPGRPAGKNCRTCPHTKTCGYAVDICADDTLKTLYVDAEHEDGYLRDACIFAPEIDIPDTMSLSVQYAAGAVATYSLVTYSPYEGWRATITGTKGRLETSEFYTGPQAGGKYYTLDMYNRTGEKTTCLVPQLSGTHGGGDARLRAMLFGAETLPDPLHAMATAKDGALSALIGIGAMQSIQTKQTVSIGENL